MNTLCYSVRLESLARISDKCYRAKSFDGREDLIPAKFIFGEDWDVQKSDAYWIAAWILKKKNIQYSTKKQAWFGENGRMIPTTTVSNHQPNKIDALNDNTIEELKR